MPRRSRAHKAAAGAMKKRNRGADGCFSTTDRDVECISISSGGELKLLIVVM